MIAVIFEFDATEGSEARYFDLAAELRPHLETIEGFISVERFESLSRPGHRLSLSFWRDEEAVTQWRRHPAHCSAQLEGRERVFADYRLRVAAVLRDYGLQDRPQAPGDAPPVPPTPRA